MVVLFMLRAECPQRHQILFFNSYFSLPAIPTFSQGSLVFFFFFFNKSVGAPFHNFSKQLAGEKNSTLMNLLKKEKPSGKISSSRKEK